MKLKVTKFNEYNNLSDDITKDMKPSENWEEEEFDPNNWEIDTVIDILDKDPNESEKDIIDDIDEAITFDMSIPKDIKRGDYLWITALIKRKNSGYNDPGRQSVIKVRVVDLYYGLAHLNKVMNK